jgi:hypothetical protein
MSVISEIISITDTDTEMDVCEHSFTSMPFSSYFRFTDEQVETIREFMMYDEAVNIENKKCESYYASLIAKIGNRQKIIDNLNKTLIKGQALLVKRNELDLFKYGDIQNALYARYKIRDYTPVQHLQFLELCDRYEMTFNDKISIINEFHDLQDRMSELQEAIDTRSDYYGSMDSSIPYMRQELANIPNELEQLRQEYQRCDVECARLGQLWRKHLKFLSQNQE